ERTRPSRCQSAPSPSSRRCTDDVLRGYSLGIGAGTDAAQVGADHALRHQFADVADALVARALELIEHQLARPIGGVELLGSLARVPGWAERRQGATDLVAVHAIVARVGARVGGVLDAAARHHFGHDLGKVADAVVVRRLPDVEGLI